MDDISLAGFELSHEMAVTGLFDGRPVPDVVGACCWFMAILYHTHRLDLHMGLSEEDFADKVNRTLAFTLAQSREDEHVAH